MEIGHAAVSATEASSVTLQIWQHGAKTNYCSYAIFIKNVYTSSTIIEMESNVIDAGKIKNINR